MFRMIGYGENIGSGFPSILKAWKEERWAEPQLTERQDLNEVHLVLKIAMDSQSSDKLESSSISSDNMESSCKSSCKSSDNMKSSSKSSCKLSDKQRAILNYLSNNPAATRHDVAENVEGLSFASTKYQVSQLKKLGYLDRVGSDKTGHWVVKVDLK